MHRKTYLLLFIAIIAMIALAVVGCKDDDGGEQEDTFDLLSTYLQNNDMDLSDIFTDWLITAPDLDADLSNYYVLDIRGADDYDTLGHITGAVNSSLTSLLTDAANNDGKTVVVTCYTGQSAAHAVVALRLSGYTDAKSLKFGMASWGDTWAYKWTDNTGDAAVGHANWTQPGSPATAQEYEYPTLSSTSTDGEAILSERVDVLLAGGFKGVANTTVLDAPTDYFINNYWDADTMEYYGNITGAYRIYEDLSFSAGGIGNIDPSKDVATYCWTGQGSSFITAYLTVLGYDALSVKFGANGMLYSQLGSHKWAESDTTYPCITGPDPS